MSKQYAAVPVKPKVRDPRNRIALSLDDRLDSALDNIAEIMGCPKTAVIVQLIIEGLPAMVKKAEEYKQAVYLGNKPNGKR